MEVVTIKGGRVVDAGGVHDHDVVMVDGRVGAVGPKLDVVGKVVDASGLLVLPGMVDTHVHLMDPGPTEREDFPHGTRAAAACGITTIVEHTHASPLRNAADLADKVAHLRGRSNVDFGLAAHLWPEDIDSMAEMWAAGPTFFKMFTCTTHGIPGLDTASVHAAFEQLARLDAPALVHCEDESLTSRAERMLRQAGRTDPRLLVEWRSREAELVAVSAVGILALATGAATTIAHVSHPSALFFVDTLRGLGADVAAEACPQYFALDEDEIEDAGPLRKFTPPARIRSDAEREAMWEALQMGRFSHISTDHAPSTREQKGNDIWQAPFGLPGLDTTLRYFLDAALSGLITLPELVRLTSAAPASRFGLSPRKGSLDVGADADVVLVDPDAIWHVRDEGILSKAGWSPFAGRSFRGRVVLTFCRGELVAEEGRPRDERKGRFIAGSGMASDAPTLVS